MTTFTLGRPDDAGRALLLVHGAGGDHALWGGVYRALRDRGVPAVAVDLPGHGRTPGPAAATITALADRIEADLRELGATTYAVAGHSMGGAAALTLASRGAPGLRGVGAVSTGARLGVDGRLLTGIVTAFPDTVARIARLCFAKGTAEAVWRGAAEAMAAVGPQVLHADFAACTAYGLTPAELAAIRVPTQVVGGDQDVMTPLALAEELAAAIPGARLTRLPGCGHMPLLENPEGLAAALAELWGRAFPA